MASEHPCGLASKGLGRSGAARGTASWHSSVLGEPRTPPQSSPRTRASPKPSNEAGGLSLAPHETAGRASRVPWEGIAAFASPLPPPPPSSPTDGEEPPDLSPRSQPHSPAPEQSMAMQPTPPKKKNPAHQLQSRARRCRATLSRRRPAPSSSAPLPLPLLLPPLAQWLPSPFCPTNGFLRAQRCCRCHRVINGQKPSPGGHFGGAVTQGMGWSPISPRRGRRRRRCSGDAPTTLRRCPGSPGAITAFPSPIQARERSHEDRFGATGPNPWVDPP